MYRSDDPRPQVVPAALWPQDSYFTDVTALDLDGSAANTSFADADLPPAGSAFFYLVVPLGTNAREGPSGY